MMKYIKNGCIVLLLIGGVSFSYAQSSKQYYIENFDGDKNLEFGAIHYLDRKGRDLKGPDKKPLKEGQSRKLALRPSRLASTYSDLFRLTEEGREKRQERISEKIKALYSPSSYLLLLHTKLEEYNGKITTFKKRDEKTVYTSIYIKSIVPTYKFIDKTINRLNKIKLTYALIATNYLGDTLYNKNRTVEKLTESEFGLRKNVVFSILEDMDLALTKVKSTDKKVLHCLLLVNEKRQSQKTTRLV